MAQQTTVIVGSQYRDGALAIVATLSGGEAVELRREPDNPHDPGAIAVYLGAVHLGYIPKHATRDIGNVLAAGGKVKAVVRDGPLMNGDGSIARGGLPRIVVSWEDASDAA